VFRVLPKDTRHGEQFPVPEKILYRHFRRQYSCIELCEEMLALTAFCRYFNNMEVVIALYSYEDIFSDFDIKGFRERALSKDFLSELEMRVRSLGGSAVTNIILLMPEASRNPEDEALILDRVKAFFAERSNHYRNEDKRSKMSSFIMIALGLALFIVPNYMVARFSMYTMLKDFLLIPAWFFIWNGLETFIKGRKTISKRKEYYATLFSAAIAFMGTEEFQRQRSENTTSPSHGAEPTANAPRFFQKSS
jgi:hypothetical protein